jgi:hypothetical protein
MTEYHRSPLVRIEPRGRTCVDIRWSADHSLDRAALDSLLDIFRHYRVKGSRGLIASSGRFEGMPLEKAEAIAAEVRTVLAAEPEDAP